MALSLVCVLGSRCCTPYAVHHREATPSSTGTSRGIRLEGNNGYENQKDVLDSSNKEKGSIDILNVNVSWRCWADVAHHVPLLGIFDDKPWFMFVVWNQLVWGLGNCLLFGIFLTASNMLRSE